MNNSRFSCENCNTLAANYYAKLCCFLTSIYAHWQRLMLHQKLQIHYCWWHFKTLGHLFNATSWVRTSNLQRHLSFSDQITILIIFFIIKAYQPGIFFSFNTVSFSVNLKLPIISNTHPRLLFGRRVQNPWSCFFCRLCHHALCLSVYIQNL